MSNAIIFNLFPDEGTVKPEICNKFSVFKNNMVNLMRVEE